MAFPKNYLSKPFSMEELIRAIEIAILGTEEKRVVGKEEGKRSIVQNDSIFVFDKTSYQKVRVQDILLIQSDGAYSLIYTNNKKHPFRISISSNHVFQNISHHSIKKVHRSYYVNLDKVEKISGVFIQVGGKKIHVTKEYSEIFDWFNFLKK